MSVVFVNIQPNINPFERYFSCTISVVCSYVRVDIYLSKYMFVMFMSVVFANIQPNINPSERYFVCTLSVVCSYVRVYICPSTYVFGMLYVFSVCLHTSKYILFWNIFLYVLYMWYVATYKSMYASLHTFLICSLTVVCAYIRADIYSFEKYFVCTIYVVCSYVRVDICPSTYLFGMLYRLVCAYIRADIYPYERYFEYTISM